MLYSDRDIFSMQVENSHYVSVCDSFTTNVDCSLCWYLVLFLAFCIVFEIVTTIVTSFDFLTGTKFGGMHPEIMPKLKTIWGCVLVVVAFAFLTGPSRVAGGGGMQFEADEDAEIYDSGFASSGKMSFTTPDLDDEHHHSLHMPDQLLCDACQIIAHMLEEKFDKVNEKRPSLKKNLPESDILDAVDDVCSDEFSMVGIKEIKGVKRLSGPGLSTKDVPGIMQGGGKWPGRMQEVCNQYAGDFEEENIYKAYKDNKLKKFLCNEEGRHCAKVLKNKTKGGKKGKNRTTKDVKEEL